jgi:hypothetical protein
MRRALFATIAAFFSASCFAVTNLDRFHSASSDAGAFMDLKFTFHGATTHTAQLFEFRVIDANNIVQSRGFYNPMGTADTVVNVPRAIPRVNGPYRLDFYADKNGSGGWDGLTDDPLHDHGWRIEPLVENAPNADPNDNVVEIVYEHNTSFTELNNFPGMVTSSAGTFRGSSARRRRTCPRWM